MGLKQGVRMKRMTVCRELAVWVLAAGSAWSQDAVRRSDVVFMYDVPEQYAAYGCTVLGWAGGGEPAHVKSAFEHGVRLFAYSVGFLTEGAGVIDFGGTNVLDMACRNFAGEPYVVPWLWDHKHKGTPYYWWCTKSPRYRSYLDSRLNTHAQSGANGLHIDDYRGTSGSVTWLSGGFCTHCLAAFREDLKARRAVDPALAAELERNGIRDLDGFDYRAFLTAQGVTSELWKNKWWEQPLSAVFLDFHVRADTAYVASYYQKAKALTGNPALTLAVNSEVANPQAMAIAGTLSYFCCEIGHDAEKRQPATQPVVAYKLADALGRAVTSTASGQDWAFIKEQQKHALVRSWTALSYSLGHNFMAPARQWCYTQEKGTHWYDAPLGQYDWLYRFVRANAALLDGYDAVARVAVVYDSAARRANKADIEPVCAELFKRNIPFAVIIAGDAWLPGHRLTPAALAAYRTVIAPEGMMLDTAQQAVIGEELAGGKAVSWKEREKALASAGAPVTVEGSDRVVVVPRVKRGDAKAPAVLHLLNQSYDGVRDVMAPQTNVTLVVRRDLYGGRRFMRAVLYAPVPESKPGDVAAASVATALLVAEAGDAVRVTVPTLKEWGLIALSE